MKNKRYVKNHPADVEMYQEVEFEVDKSLKSREERLKRKKPISVALDEDTINRLKVLAEEKGIP
jgi:hypothetical protein